MKPLYWFIRLTLYKAKLKLIIMLDYKTFKTTAGVLKARVARQMQDYVVIELIFNDNEPDYKTITQDSFDGLVNWIDDNYEVFYQIK